MAVRTPHGVHLDHAAMRAHALNDRLFAERLEHRDEAGPPPRGPHDVERRPLPRARPSRPSGPEQLPVEVQERLQPLGTCDDLEKDGTGSVGGEALDTRHELVHQLTSRPRPPSPLPDPCEVPRQLKQTIGAAPELDHIEHVRRTRDHAAREVTVASADPGPLAGSVERLAHGIARRLRAPVEPRRVVRQRRAIP